jgi:LysM repeat protein
MLIVLIGSALVLAGTTFIAILMLTNRPSGPTTPAAEADLFSSGSTVNVNGVPVLIEPDSAKTIILVSELGGVGGQNALPTDTPIPPTAGPTETPVPTAAPTRDPNPVIFKDYTVAQGDTLYSIADTQNSSIELMAKYGIDDGDLIPGQPFPKPLPYANPAYCPGATPYVVRDKDTVYRISVQFNTSVEVIAQYNGLNTDYFIEVTQVICIPT